MMLRDFLTPERVNLDLEGDSKEEILAELVGLLPLDTKSRAVLVKTLTRRENLGSTGIGKGIAIPHCRSLVVKRLQMAYGRKVAGTDFKSIDDRPVHSFFLIVAPPLEVSNQYLPVLGRVAQFAKEPDVPAKLLGLASADDLFTLLEQKGL